MGIAQSKWSGLRSGLMTQGPWLRRQTKSALGAAFLIIALVVLMGLLRTKLFDSMLDGAPRVSAVGQIEVLPARAVGGLISENWVRDISARMYAGVITIVTMAAAVIGIVTVSRFLYIIGGFKLTLFSFLLALWFAYDRGPKILKGHRLTGEPFDAIAKQANLDVIFEGIYWVAPRFVGFIPVFYFVILFIALCFRGNEKWYDPKELRFRLGAFYVSMAMSAILLMLGVMRNMSRLTVIALALPTEQSDRLLTLSRFLCVSYGISLSAIAIAALVPCLYCINRDIDSAAAEAIERSAKPKTPATFKMINEWRETHGLVISLPAYVSVILTALAPVVLAPNLDMFKGIQVSGLPANHGHSTSGSKQAP
jgi:hypothetical protein